MSLCSPRRHIGTWSRSWAWTIGRRQSSTQGVASNLHVPRSSTCPQDFLPSFFHHATPHCDDHLTPPPIAPLPTPPPAPIRPPPIARARIPCPKPVLLPRAPDKSLYGKWKFLLEDNERVRSELSGISPDGGVLFIDNPEWRDDVVLWACLLDVSLRWNRRSGALHILKLFLARSPDVALDGQVADFFWDSMTAVSLDHGDVFEEVVGAAHMIAHSRNAAWPRLYVTSIRAFLENKRFGEARDWHIKLMPMFDPGPQAFASIMTSFAPNLDPQCQAALRSIYSHSNYRDLYDKVVPLLHRQGKENAARDWRSLFLQYHDRPRSAVSGPFVRFLSQYFPDEGLCEEELMVSHPSFTPQSLAQQPSSPESTESETYAKPPPNDRLIARWFASEWTSIEFSFTVIHKLGVRRIGSASLQSLGLRCESSLELLACVKDLKALGITVTQSNYTNAVLRIARSKTDDQLFELLKSDVHPDVFEDIPTLRKILAASTAAGDWKKHRLFTTILAHLNEDATPKLYRDALLRCFKGPWRWASALRLLNNATCNNVKIRLSAFNTFMNAIVDDAKKRSSNGLRAHTSVVVSICLNAMERGYAVPCQIWSIILSSLSRTGQIQEIESIGNELIAHYTRLQYTGKSIRIHSSDAAFRKPESLKRHSRTSFPASTSFSNKYHPLRLIFNERVVMDILSSGFRSPLSRPAVALADTMSVFSKQPLPPSAFGPATGVRLLRILHDRGVPIQRGFVQSAIVYAALDWKPKPWKIKYHLLLTTSWRAYSLQDIKIMCDKAWGSEILPDIATFQDMVQEARAQIVENKRMRDEEYKKIARNVYGRRI